MCGITSVLFEVSVYFLQVDGSEKGLAAMRQDGSIRFNFGLLLDCSDFLFLPFDPEIGLQQGGGFFL